MKTCSNCEQIKALDEFYEGKGRCKVCYNAAQRDVRSKQTIEQRASRVRRQIEYQRTPSGRAVVRSAQLKHRYGITQADYDEMLVRQGGVCAICRTNDPSPHRNFSVDHDHVTGQVRGLLCLKCNNNVGWLENVSPERVAYYLAGGFAPSDR